MPAAAFHHSTVDDEEDDSANHKVDEPRALMKIHQICDVIYDERDHTDGQEYFYDHDAISFSMIFRCVMDGTTAEMEPVSSAIFL